MGSPAAAEAPPHRAARPGALKGHGILLLLDHFGPGGAEREHLSDLEADHALCGVFDVDHGHDLGSGLPEAVQLIFRHASDADDGASDCRRLLHDTVSPVGLTMIL